MNTQSISPRHKQEKEVLQLRITGLLLGVDMPDNVIRQAVNTISRPLCHLRKSFRLGLVFKGVAGEIDAWWDFSMSARV